MAALLLLAAAALPQAAFGQGAQRTVRIAAVHSQNGAVTSVDLAVSAGSEAVSLYAVHGAVDQGSDLNAWDAVDPGTPVPASESETTVNYPVSRPHDDFEVVYPGLRVLSMSEPCNGRHGLVIIVR